MATITEDYVSFETAKLLKEKGFNVPCGSCYKYFRSNVTMYHGYGPEYIKNHNKDKSDMNIFSRPTQQMAMAWLRKEYKMYVCIDIKCFMPHLGKIDGYSACIWYKPENNAGICCYWVYPPKQQEAWDAYEAAVEAAIKYCLEHLI